MRSRELLDSSFEPTEKRKSDRLFDILGNYADRFRDQLLTINPQLRQDVFFELIRSSAYPSRNDPLPLLEHHFCKTIELNTCTIALLILSQRQAACVSDSDTQSFFFHSLRHRCRATTADPSRNLPDYSALAMCINTLKVLCDLLLLR